MRSAFPINSKQMTIELNEIEEQIIKVLGYDVEIWDDHIDVSGVYDIIDSIITASGTEMIQNRIQSSLGLDRPIYSTFGMQEVKYNVMRNIYDK